jgi:hypothetical protein
VESDQGRRQDGVLGRGRNVADHLALVGREGRNEHEADDVLGVAFEMKAPAYE